MNKTRRAAKLGLGRSLVSLLVWVWAAHGSLTAALAEQPPHQREADKAKQVQTILQKHPMTIYEGVQAKDRPFCDRFYQALKNAGPEIRYVEPVLRAVDRDHPGLARYRACDQYGGAPGEFSFVLCAVGERRFRLYRLELDGDRRNGPEEYLYGQEPSCYQFAPIAQYARIKFDTCEFEDFLPVAPEDPVDTERSHAPGGINALVSYQRRHFAYDIENFEEAGMTMNLRVFDSLKRRFSFSTLCRWKTRNQ